MAAWNWTTGRLTRVIHPVGKFANGDDRYRRAQYDFLKWDISGTEEGYVLVPPADKQTGAQETITSGVQEGDHGLEYGYYNNDTYITDVRGSSNTDTWPGLHSFGFV